jgi:hypothetical protein
LSRRFLALKLSKKRKLSHPKSPRSLNQLPRPSLKPRPSKKKKLLPKRRKKQRKKRSQRRRKR